MVNLTDTTGTIDPASVNFDDGIEDGQATVGVTISVVQTDVQITASYDYDETLIESSTNAFDVKVGTQVEIPSDGPWPFEFTFANGVSITVPDGAIDFGGETSTTLTCNTVDTGLPDTLGGITETVLAAEFSFDPVVTLTDAVTVCFPYDPGALQTETPEESLRLYEVDVDKWIFIVGSYVDMDNDKVCADVTEFSTLGVLGGYPYGDATNDADVNAGDAIQLLQYDVGTRPDPLGDFGIGNPSDDFVRQTLDVTRDDPTDTPTDPDAGDAIQILQIDVGSRTNFTILGGTLEAPSLALKSETPNRIAYLSSDIQKDKAIFCINLDDAAGIFGAKVFLEYDNSLLTVSEVSKSNLTSDSLMAYNGKKAGKVIAAVAKGEPLGGSGEILHVEFDIASYADVSDIAYSVRLEEVKLYSGSDFIKAKLMNPVPKEFALLQNYPNPFNPETWIPYELDRASDVEIRIYNVNGEMIRNIALGQQVPGYYVTREKAAYWNGLNNHGERVSSGIYFYQVLANSKESQIRKMVILK
jgi:hypothetical protein